MKETPNYYAIIPANVRYDKNICSSAKLLYGEITSLCNKNGRCWATNKYFSELYSVTTVTISKWVRELKDNGYIKSELIYKEGTKEILNRYLTLVYDPPKEKYNTPIKEKFKGNTKEVNTKSNNEKVYKKKFENKAEELKSGITDESYKSVIDWMLKNTPTLLEMDKPLKYKEFLFLKHNFSKSYMKDLFERMENHKPLKKKNKSVSRTFLNWAKRDGAYKPK